jgi:hypothetical protein
MFLYHGILQLCKIFVAIGGFSNGNKYILQTVSTELQTKMNSKIENIK